MIRNIAIATVLSAIISVPALANKKADLKAELTPSVTYLGSADNVSLFAINVENASPAKFEIVVKNPSGDELFSKTYEAATFSKVFKLVNDGSLNNNGVTFQVRELKSGANHNFEVNSEVAYVKDVEITKI